jgi:hypothetical protein
LAYLVQRRSGRSYRGFRQSARRVVAGRQMDYRRCRGRNRNRLSGRRAKTGLLPEAVCRLGQLLGVVAGWRDSFPAGSRGRSCAPLGVRRRASLGPCDSRLSSGQPALRGAKPVQRPALALARRQVSSRSPVPGSGISVVAGGGHSATALVAAVPVAPAADGETPDSGGASVAGE